MEKTELLLEKTRLFKELLIETERQDSGLSPLLEKLTPLFDDIENGRVIPPCVGRFQAPFHSEDSRYGFRQPIYSAAAEFEAALEDWRSKPWYPK
jgi:hypothetical protein